MRETAGGIFCVFLCRLDDGAIELEVTLITDGVINCRVIHGGRLGNSKSVNLPETKLALSAVSPENRDDIVNGAEDLGVELNEHIQFVIDAMAEQADLLKLNPGDRDS